MILQGLPGQALVQASKSLEAQWPVSPCPAYGCNRNLKGHFLIGSALTLLPLNRPAPLPPPLTPSHSQAHIAKQLASRQEAGEGYLFLASSLRRPQGAGNLLASSISHPNKPCLSVPTLDLRPPCLLSPYRMLSCLGFSWLWSPLPTSPKQSLAEGNAASRTESHCSASLELPCQVTLAGVTLTSLCCHPPTALLCPY